MRWMMYRWWCEGGGDRAWRVIESVFLRSPDKGFWACLGDIPPDMPMGGPRIFVACKLFFYLREKTIFFLAINVRQFFVNVLSKHLGKAHQNVVHCLKTRISDHNAKIAKLALYQGRNIHVFVSENLYISIKRGLNPWFLHDRRQSTK